MGSEPPPVDPAPEPFDPARLRVPTAPLVEFVGLVWDELGPDRVVAHVDADERLHQPYGIVHGGVYATIVETVGSVGAAIHVHDSERVAVGIHNATDFLRPHRTGRLTVVGTPLHAGRLQHLWEVVVTRDEDSKVVARGQVRLQILDGHPLRSSGGDPG